MLPVRAGGRTRAGPVRRQHAGHGRHHHRGADGARGDRPDGAPGVDAEVLAGRTQREDDAQSGPDGEGSVQEEHAAVAPPSFSTGHGPQ